MRQLPQGSCWGWGVTPTQYVVIRRWNDHKVMVRWLSRFFNYLDR